MCVCVCVQELLEQRRQRRASRQELGKRRSAASQNRMRIISQLAEEAAVGKRSKRSKEDTFGMNDDDWNVYRAIVSSTKTSRVCSYIVSKRLAGWSCEGLEMPCSIVMKVCKHSYI